METSFKIKPNPWALVPFLVFAVFYVGASVAVNDFYAIPMPIAFLIASATALMFSRQRSFADRVDTYALGMGDANIMIMCLVFILAGAFASVAKGTGAVDAAVLIAQRLVPSSLMLAGVFAISCLISLAIGTSCGTIAAVTPIALGFSSGLGLSPAMLVGAVVGGSMFGDNLSMISDTTIAATRTQGIAMREKFIANLWIAAPAAIGCLVIYCLIGIFGGQVEVTAVAVTWQHLLLILPYVLILVLALFGLNVMTLLFFGVALAAVIGVALGKVDVMGALALMKGGMIDMSETLIVALLAGGMFRTVYANGGIQWLTDRISLLVRGPRTCEFGVFLLVSMVNFFTANNTVAIVIAGPIAKECSVRFGAVPARIASVLDTASCIVQGLIPYGAQILIALGVAKAAGVTCATSELIKCLYYQPLLAIAVIVTILLPRRFGASRR